MASLLDKDDDPMRGVEVTLVADLAGLSAEAHGSWLHHRSFRQQKSTSSLGCTWTQFKTGAGHKYTTYSGVTLCQLSALKRLKRVFQAALSSPSTVVE